MSGSQHTGVKGETQERCFPHCQKCLRAERKIQSEKKKRNFLFYQESCEDSNGSLNIKQVVHQRPPSLRDLNNECL